MLASRLGMWIAVCCWIRCSSWKRCCKENKWREKTKQRWEHLLCRCDCLHFASSNLPSVTWGVSFNSKISNPLGSRYLFYFRCGTIQQTPCIGILAWLTIFYDSSFQLKTRKQNFKNNEDYNQTHLGVGHFSARRLKTGHNIIPKS